MAENTKPDGQKKQSFFAGVKSEWRKIVWTDRKSLVKQTVLVVVISVIVGALIAVVDNASLQLLNLIV